ncbi:hypothetical protein KCP74_01890 [Salmonella enterica subsp. enterica]|nr:hypothetical protein KCP74_01890 [Salmonella enterica subsp. enterica]
MVPGNEILGGHETLKNRFSSEYCLPEEWRTKFPLRVKIISMQQLTIPQCRRRISNSLNVVVLNTKFFCWWREMHVLGIVQSGVWFRKMTLLHWRIP